MAWADSRGAHPSRPGEKMTTTMLLGTRYNGLWSWWIRPLKLKPDASSFTAEAMTDHRLENYRFAHRSRHCITMYKRKTSVSCFKIIIIFWDEDHQIRHDTAFHQIFTWKSLSDARTERICQERMQHFYQVDSSCFIYKI